MDRVELYSGGFPCWRLFKSTDQRIGISQKIMDLKDQLKTLFPEHTESPAPQSEVKPTSIWMQDTPIICKYEKRKGKPITIIEGYTVLGG